MRPRLSLSLQRLNLLSLTYLCPSPASTPAATMIASFLFVLFLLPSIALCQPLRGVSIDCGGSVPLTSNGLQWLPDTDYISAGSPHIITAEGLNPVLATVRTFPLRNNLFKKFCYEIPVDRLRKYLVRTTYYYGGVNVNVNPPIFDQIVDGVLWSVVNTTEDYARRTPRSYEGVFMAMAKNLSVCLAANTYTDSDPFISAVEVVQLLDQLYNSTNLMDTALDLVARSNFGYSGPAIGYPNDQFNRFWGPFGETNSIPSNSSNVAVSGIWNLPPAEIFQTRIESSQGESLVLPWPPFPLPPTNYSIALYFAEDRTVVSGSSRVLDITVNGVTYYNNLNILPAGVVVFANQWPLAGVVNITLSSAPGSMFGPLINAGELFREIPAGDRTLPRDEIAMIDLRRSFRNPPADWYGDPCFPRQYRWTGVTCSEGPRNRVVSLNLTSMGLSGSLSPSVDRLTALNSILLGNNSLSGNIPAFGSLRMLEILHLEDNQLDGPIPPSLGNLPILRELFLQNNNLTGQVPRNLTGKPELNLRYTPGNPLLIPPQS